MKQHEKTRQKNKKDEPFVARPLEIAKNKKFLLLPPPDERTRRVTFILEGRDVRTVIGGKHQKQMK